jgi:peroxiredoxin
MKTSFHISSRQMVFAAFTLIAWMTGSAPVIGEVQTLKIGASAPHFELRGVDGRTHSLDDYADASVLVIVFNTNHCPTAQAYEERLKQLADDYKEKGVALVVIQPNDPQAVRLDERGYTDLGDTFDEMKLRAEHRQFNFPYLDDGDTQEVTRAYGPLVTPHVFIFDADRKLRYEGRIDDGENPEAITSHDARNAIDALLKGQEVPVKTTTVFGCTIKWPAQRKQAEASLARWNQETATLERIDDDALKALVANDSGKTRLINVWATWCGPCVAELPDFVDMHRMYRNRDRLEIITISMDEPERQDRALQVLNKRQASMTNFIYAGASRDKLVEGLDEQWRGPVPHTILVAPGGKVLYRHTGPIVPHEVRRVIADQIGRTYFD